MERYGNPEELVGTVLLHQMHQVLLMGQKFQLMVDKYDNLKL